ncbi:DnaB-like helicase C-terminal domain-containing protein [Bacillus licheniformis]
MALVITEQDIFKYLVPHEDVDLNIRSNTRIMLTRIPVNIFKDEYYILYRAFEAANKHNIWMGYEQLHQILLNNLEDIIDDPKVTLFEDEQLPRNELMDKILDYTLHEYDDLCSLDIEDADNLKGNMQLYIQTWAVEKSREITLNKLEILNEGKKFGRIFYKGIEDAHNYYQKAYEVVRALLEADAGKLSESIDTSVDTVEDINRKMQEETVAEPIAHTGVDQIDKQITAFYKGEIVVIQAGTGVGKTRKTVNIAYNGLKRGKNVLYLSLEQKATRIYPMFLARHILEMYGDIAELTDKDIIRKTYSMVYEPQKTAAEIDFIQNENIGRLKIEGRSLMANDLYNYLVRTWEEGFHFDIVVLDYLGLLEVQGGRRYDVLTETINMLKSEVKSFKGKGFLGLIPNQLSTDAEEQLEKGEYDLLKKGGSETQYVSRAADYVFTLQQNDRMKKDSVMRIINSKVRLGQAPQPFYMADVDLGKCVFVGRPEDEDDDDDL